MLPLPSVPQADFTVQERQAVRLRRFLLACAGHAAALALLAVAWFIGQVPAWAALLIAAAALVLNLALYAALRSGLNLRFKDPSLTQFQIGAAITLLMFTIYFVERDRGAALTICFLIFTFGIFRLTTREFVTLTLYTLACYALVVNLLMHFRPEVIASVTVEWINWLVLAAVLPGFTLLAARVSRLQNRLRASNFELRSAVDAIQELATQDDLTGLYNRAFFVENLRHALARRERARTELAVLFVDVDRFKHINDALGHRAGDRVLAELAARFRRCLRGGDVAARLGGDDFVILIENLASGSGAAEVANKLLATSREPVLLEGRDVPLSVSIGGALSPADATDVETLLRCADLAMYRAKDAGRDRVRFFSKEMMAGSAHRLALEADLRRALARGEMRLLFQPVVEMGSDRISAAEALLRWQHPSLGLLTPDRFIGLAEDTGLIVPIGHWVLREACRRAAAWPSLNGGPLRVAVNLSPRQFRDPGLLADLRAALGESGLAPGRLDLEITESTAMRRPERALAVTQEIRGLGVGLSMDDFGTGYSSLGMLKRFPFSNIKIDRAFVRELPQNANDVGITRAAIAMARSLRLNVIAEGVEHQSQADFLRAEGCTEFQGYLCSPPVTEDRLLALCGEREKTCAS
ncbi:MAG: EAL domain-containing protein [Betaproteobacteria bacterium]|nr:EAL domain-containing protein [Betaproteobacteria bacterium]